MPGRAHPAGSRDTVKMADGEGGCTAGRELEPGLGLGPGPGSELEPGEEFEIVDRSQLPGPGDLRSATRPRAAEGWSAPILTLARRATGNLSASCGSALRAAAGLGGGDSGDGTARAGRLGPGLSRGGPACPRWPLARARWGPGWEGAGWSGRLRELLAGGRRLAALGSLLRRPSRDRPPQPRVPERAPAPLCSPSN